MGEWKEYLLDEVIEKFIDYRGKTPTKTTSGVPLITAKVVKNGTIEEPNEFISKEDYHNWMRRGYPEVDDVVITTEAPLGEVALLKSKDVALAQRIITLRAYPKKAYNPFIKYYLQSPSGQYELESRASGTTVLGIKSSVLKKLPVIIPDKDEQVAIASVLLSLDNKIDLLHRQNKTLEAMAETLFRQWFVEEAEEGWEEYVLTDIASHLKNSVNPGQHPTRIFHHYSLPAYDEGREPSPELGDTIKSSKYVVPENAVLVSKLNPRFPRVWPVRDKKHEHPISSTEFQVFVPKKDEIFGFLYCFLISKPVQDELASAASGTSGSHQRVSPDDIKALTFQAKSKQQLVDFSKVVDPLLEKIDTNKDQVANLTKLRDTLLPKLMSGEVRVEMNTMKS
ncbi:MAG: restriction endonuclease subunit S [Flavobacteriales bacterium]|nr:MAG: restriction endonuclease subunit S [Flavobacteriales bacterium]